MPIKSELGNKYALAALREKRATLAGEIQALKKQIEFKHHQLAHVDATLGIFDPTYAQGSIKPKKHYQRIHLFKQGQLSRAIVDGLRRAGKPLSTPELVTIVVKLTGAGEAGRVGMNHRVRASLQYLNREQGIVEKIGERSSAKWALKH
jgi:hypothetical protein